MAVYGWNEIKNRQLRESRGIGFEDVVESIAAGGLIDVLEHPHPERYQNQRVFVLRLRGYVYLVTFLESPKELFLKTIIPSRKFTKIYGGEK